MTDTDPFLLSDEMRDVLAFDQAFRDVHDFTEKSVEEQILIESMLSLHWAADGPEMESIHSVMLPIGDNRIELRTFTPANDAGDRYVVWVHGGGWREGSLDGYERLMRVLAESAACPVVGVGYTMAPMAQFPRQIGELLAAYEFVAKQLLPQRTLRYVAGYSAGANLIMSSLTYYQERLGKDYFARAALACGVYDCEFTTASYQNYEGYFGSSSTRMTQLLELYAPGAIARQDPVVFSVNSRQNVCRNFLILTAEHDLLKDESGRLVASLSSQGHNAAHLEIPGVTHIFIQRSRAMVAARQAIQKLGRYLAQDYN